ncbi:hypothetical protein JYU34_000441 [Plutella xylostella]|uniref:PEHE domain-containing protein n=1 Tax=Plutella xylostella TaxID=51655 RepID=A0ABQ7R7P7_PLUXY|nr:hypothetical protein JYU34_000441 [Plutella xylostella]
MNSRSSVKEKLVKFPTEISTLNQLEAKDGLLSFSFDHIYACPSESKELDPESVEEVEEKVDVSSLTIEETVIAPPVPLPPVPVSSDLNAQLTTTQQQNKNLKALIVYHLDLIQQQNDIISKTEKKLVTIRQENETLKSRLQRMDRRVTLNQRHSSNPPPLVHVAGVTQPPVKTETVTNSSQVMLNSITEFLLPEPRTNSFILDGSDINKISTYTQDYSLKSASEKDVPSLLPSDFLVTPLHENKKITPPGPPDFKMVEKKRMFGKTETKTELRPEQLYAVTANSVNPAIQKMQRNRRRTAPTTTITKPPAKSPAPVKLEIPETITNPYDEDKMFDRNFTVNKKSKMINTYGKSRNGNNKLPPPPPPKPQPPPPPPTTPPALEHEPLDPEYTALSDRLQLVDPTPTGVDPYQLCDEDLRDQSPIPKLMLLKNNQGRMQVRSAAPAASRPIYDPAPPIYEPVPPPIYEPAPPEPEDPNKIFTKIKLNKYNLTNTYMHPDEIKKEDVDSGDDDDPDLDIVKTEPEIDWRIYTTKSGPATSLCDFSYGETQNLTLPQLNSMEIQSILNTDSPLFQDGISQDEFNFKDKKPPEVIIKKPIKPGSPYVDALKDATSLLKPPERKGRKRALSTTNILKNMKKEMAPKAPPPPKPKIIRPKKAPAKPKKAPVPGFMTKKPYHTQVGGPDVSWYLGLDPDIKPEDVDPPAPVKNTVEVPRWREKIITGAYCADVEEDLDDKVFEKRHQKLELEERRQLRWHMRRIREQRHIERLRQRQRDSWSTNQQPSTFTVWPQPQRDVRFIEITDTLPVTALGEPMPALPKKDFVLPWVRTSKAQKRSKRSKTLH